ncbi:MAG TPA: LacI family DNA-binding transcriptional regulator [Capsulimonadaceae bacterium]|jgi:DNA-binding LacI/PurR family transcriptional regulator
MIADQSENQKKAPPARLLPTLQDVANALGMHKSTVSVALSGKGALSADTRQLILSKAREMGYVPNPVAQRLATGYQNHAVCIISAGLDLGLATEKILLIQQELTSLGMDVPIYTCSEAATPTSRPQSEQVQQICSQRPRAVICGSQIVDEKVFSVLDTYQRTGGVVVTYDSRTPLDCDKVIFDREHNAHLTTSYLLSRGHRKIGIAMSTRVSWLPNMHLTQPDRMLGYRRALAEYGVPFREDYVFQHGAYERGGEELARQFLALDDRPTGICIVNDYVALAFMVEVMQRGVRIPEDLSVVGHDNQPIAAYCPVPLTAASQPSGEIAHTVVRMLRDRLDGRSDTPQTITVCGNLVERQSVATINDSRPAI